MGNTRGNIRRATNTSEMAGTKGEYRFAQRPASLVTTLEEPVALLGLQSQRLGIVERIFVDPRSRRVAYYELRTDWQRLLVESDSVIFDSRDDVLRLRKNASLIEPRG